MAKPMVTTAAASIHSASNRRTWLRGRSLMFAQASRGMREEAIRNRRDQRVANYYSSGTRLEAWTQVRAFMFAAEDRR
jgi:hypothetical protein